MAAGNIAPDISWEEYGEAMNLYGLKADTVIVIFWADWFIKMKSRKQIILFKH